MTAVRRTLQGMASDVPAASVRMMRDNVGWLRDPLRLGAAVFTAYGMLAAIVAALGLYSVLSFLVIEQRHANAIRVALGATARRVVAPVVGQSIATIAIGFAIGIMVLVAARRFMTPLLFQTRLLEPIVVEALVASALVIAAAASAGPVRRVVRTDPMLVLRQE
jgi:ABC-type antimicrobial peptide transport system permease subunit